MAHIDDSLAMTVPTSESFTGSTVIINTDDRTSLTGLDRMEIIICFTILIFFSQRDLTNSSTELAHVKLFPSYF